MAIVKFFLLVLFGCLVSCEKQATDFPTALDENLERAENLNAKQSYREAYLYYDKSFAYNQELGYTKRMVYCLLRMAEIEKVECDYAGSEETATRAIALFDDTIPIAYQVNAYIGLGLNYTHLNNFDEGLKNYHKALQLTDDELSRCIIQNNIAYLYSKDQHFHKAISILNQIEKNEVLMATPIDYARVLHNKGYFLFHLKRKEALSYLNKALVLRRANPDDSQLVSSYMHLAAYFAHEQPHVANEWANKAYDSALHAKIPDDQLEALNLLFNTTSDVDKKNNYHERYIQLNDSILQARQQSKNQFAKIKYDAAKIRTEKAAYQFKMYVYVVLLFLSVVIFTLVYRLTQQRNKRKLFETQYHTETKIAKQLHDELANDVHNTIAFVETQNLEHSNNKELLLHNLDTLYTRARNISKENSEIRTDVYYADQLRNMIATYASNNVHVIIQNLEDVYLDWNRETKIVVYRTLQELMVNMKKHSGCSVVSLRFKNDASGIEINYSDNGVGVEKSRIIKNGLENVEKRIFSIHGRITFDTEPGKGFKVKILIPN
jgi:signal transduction histidine kinase